MRSLRRECLDHILPLSEGQVRSVLAEFVSYYNQDWPHRSLGDPGAEPSAARRAGGFSACPQRLAPRLRASRMTLIDFSRPTGRVEPGRGVGVSTDPFPRPALQTGHARYHASGSPRVRALSYKTASRFVTTQGEGMRFAR